MGRRRGKPKPRFFASGVLAVDKPAGPTSHDVVARLRGRFGPAKIGHAGTLDPFATGVLVVLFNQATKLADLLGGGQKEYTATLALGRRTDTGDHTGEEVDAAPVPELTTEAVEQALAAMVGPRMQSPPAYSAAKFEGRPLYSYARSGQTVQKPAKPITIYDAQLLGLAPDAIDFRMRCSRGAYIRSLGEDLARDLGTVGHLAALRRTASLPFRVEQAIELEQALDLSPEDLARRLLEPAEALARHGLPAATLGPDEAWRLRQGQQLPAEMLFPRDAARPEPGEAFRVLDDQGSLVAVLQWAMQAPGADNRAYDVIRVFPEADKAPESQTSASALSAE